jgi:16S rRNA (adenine1518-N6/adenine1519-N6)-dimethyltransferase
VADAPALLSAADIADLLARYGLRPSRALGQNFLADPNTARRIVRLAELPAGLPVVEVGPGLGSLTLALCGDGHSVRAVELDQHIRPALAAVVDGCDVDVVAGDALTIDWAAELHDQPHWAMVANLPYNVATPVVVRALETAPMIDRFLVMVQREVGERLAAPPGSKTYGAVSVKVAFYGRAKVVGIVPPSVFVPKPHVESALVRIERHPGPPVVVPSVDRLFELVGAGFATRRKSLRQSLRRALGDRTDAVLACAGIEPMTRAEALGLTEWATLASADRDTA